MPLTPPPVFRRAVNLPNRMACTATSGALPSGRTCAHLWDCPTTDGDVQQPSETDLEGTCLHPTQTNPGTCSEGGQRWVPVDVEVGDEDLSVLCASALLTTR